jgi:hypothetical protein
MDAKAFILREFVMTNSCEVTYIDNEKELKDRYKNMYSLNG